MGATTTKNMPLKTAPEGRPLIQYFSIFTFTCCIDENQGILNHTPELF